MSHDTIRNALTSYFIFGVLLYIALVAAGGVVWAIWSLL